MTSLFSLLHGRRWLNDWEYPESVYDPYCGIGVQDTSVLRPRLHVIHPRAQNANSSPGAPEVKNEKDKFQVLLNVRHFKPSEMEVKLIDNYVLIHGKHEEKTDDHGFIQREFTRRYMLPEETEMETLKSTYSLDGILSVEASKKVVETTPPSNERVIPIILGDETEVKK